MTVLVAMPAHAGLGDQPLPPAALVAVREEAGNALSWLPPAWGAQGVLSYNVYRLNGTSDELLATVPADQTTYTDESAHQDYLYTYYVTSQGSNGESPPSNPSPAGYPHCTDVFGPEGIAYDCYLPPPGGGDLLQLGILRS